MRWKESEGHRQLELADTACSNVKTVSVLRVEALRLCALVVWKGDSVEYRGLVMAFAASSRSLPSCRPTVLTACSVCPAWGHSQRG